MKSKLQSAECVVYGCTAIYALRGDSGPVRWETGTDKDVPQLAPCPRCVNRVQCLSEGGGVIDIKGCPVAEGWRDATAAYEAATKPQEAAE